MLGIFSLYCSSACRSTLRLRPASLEELRCDNKTTVALVDLFVPFDVSKTANAKGCLTVSDTEVCGIESQVFNAYADMLGSQNARSDCRRAFEEQ